MAHISRGRKSPSSQETFDALVRELRTGIKLQEALENQREIIAAHEAAEMRSAKTFGELGKFVTNMPGTEYFNLIKKYGHDEVHSKSFLRYHQKHFPHLAGASI